MTKSWRPEGWDSIKLKAHTGTSEEALARQANLFEAGADAMLNVLREMSRRDSPLIVGMTGVSVFIPDDG